MAQGCGGGALRLRDLAIIDLLITGVLLVVAYTDKVIVGRA